MKNMFIKFLPFVMGGIMACDDNDKKVDITYSEPVIQMMNTGVIGNVYTSTKQNISDGIDLYEVGCYNKEKQTHFFIAEVDLNKVTFTSSTPNDKNELPVEAGGDAQVYIHAGAAEANGKKVWLGFNGDYWTGSPGKPMGLFIKDGVLLNSRIYEGHTEVIYMRKDGSVGVGLHDDIYDQYDQLMHAVGGRGLLVRNGEVKKINDAVTKGRNPRTAVGITSDKKKLYFFVVDGRRSWYSEGLELDDLAILMNSVGCQDAIALDGGGSSTLVKRKEGNSLTDFIVVNKPSDSGGARKIANGILIIAKE